VTGAFTGADVISALHPALAGHFPGNPVVPGVVILGRVCEAFRRDHDARVTRVTLVKFHAPLRPAEPFAIHLAQTGAGRCAFRVVRGDTLIAAGTLETGDVRQ
jgi:3-hydroxyacyl-[acyl-carrier-protein] dehydratase